VRTPLRRLPPAVLLIVVLMAGSGCGGADNDKDATALLDSAFKQSIKSADMSLDAQIQVSGSSSFGRPLRVKATGPFRTDKGKLPWFDIDVNASAGPGQTFQIGFVSTGDRVFTKFQDVYYEQPRSQVDQTIRSLNKGGPHKSLRALGIDPRRWLEGAHSEGDQEVAGTQTTQVTGRLNVSRVLKDLNRFLKRSGTAISGATGQASKPLSDSLVKRFTEDVKDPTFDVYVAKSDHTIRRLSGHVEFKGGSASFTLEFTKVNGNQKIVAPAKAHPISQLTSALGLGLLGGGSSDGSGSNTPAPSPSAPSADAYKRYANCLDKAKSDDTDALQRCADLLH
jgi:hypothetical protein